MDEIDFSILDMLDIKDIQVACKHADLEILLKPIKDHPDFYKKYVKQLGSNRPDKKSSIVKLYMPRIAFDLFQKGDVTYKGVIVQILENYKSKFEEAMTEYIKPPIDIEEIKAYNAEQLVELYFKIVDVSATDAPIDFYFMMQNPLLREYGKRWLIFNERTTGCASGKKRPGSLTGKSEGSHYGRKRVCGWTKGRQGRLCL